MDLIFANAKAKIYIDKKHTLIYSRWYQAVLNDEWWAATNAVLDVAHETGYDAYISDAHQGVILDQKMAKTVAEEVIPRQLETNLRLMVAVIPEELSIEMSVQNAINAFPPSVEGVFCHTLPEAIAWIERKREECASS